MSGRRKCFRNMSGSRIAKHSDGPSFVPNPQWSLHCVRPDTRTAPYPLTKNPTAALSPPDFSAPNLHNPFNNSHWCQSVRRWSDEDSLPINDLAEPANISHQSERSGPPASSIAAVERCLSICVWSRRKQTDHTHTHTLAQSGC